MSNKKQAEKDFEEKIKERDAFVADGFESYPVRLYKIIFHFLINKKRRKGNCLLLRTL